jgi:hypothetical protein
MYHKNPAGAEAVLLLLVCVVSREEREIGVGPKEIRGGSLEDNSFCLGNILKMKAFLIGSQGVK